MRGKVRTHTIHDPFHHRFVRGRQIVALGRDPDAELEREMQTVRDTAAKIPVLPVLSLGVSYRW